MTEQELQQARRDKWRLAGQPVRTLDDARAFLESVGICLMYPHQENVLAPTFIGAYSGSDDRLPTWQHAFADPRAQQATELMVRLLREKTAFEANLFGETNFLVAAPVFPYLYGLVGDHNPRQTVKPGKHSAYSPLARDVFEVIREQGKISKPRLREILGGELSSAALDRALHELWSKLRITRVDYNPEEGAFWDALYRWAPEPVRRGLYLSAPQALSALVSKYLDAVVAAEPGEVEEFFSYLVPRSRVREAVNALLAARELSFVTVGKKTMLQITPRRPDITPRQPRKA
jgi:hypothetical protein